MDYTIPILFCIWFVFEVIDNIKKYKMEDKQKFVLETLREEFHKMQSKIKELEKENHHLRCMVNDLSEEMG